MRTTLVTIIIFLLSYGSIVAQSSLILKKRNKVIAIFKEGDRLRFQLTGERFYYNHMITGFAFDKVRFNYFDLRLEEIGILHVKNPKKNIANVIYRLGIQGGVFFLLIDQLNQVVINGDDFGPSDQTYLISGSMIAAGLLARLFVKKKFKTDGTKYHLELR